MKKNVFFFIMLIVALFAACEDTPVDKSGGITGVVTNTSTGEPISGVNLTLSPSGLSKVSGSDGRYEFQEIDPQQYDVQAQAAGYKYNVKQASVVVGQTTKCDIPLQPQN